MAMRTPSRTTTSTTRTPKVIDGPTHALPFRVHGVVDMCQAAFTGLGPVLFGFGGNAAAQAFYAQAALETGVAAATDFSAPDGRQLAAASV